MHCVFEYDINDNNNDSNDNNDNNNNENNNNDDNNDNNDKYNIDDDNNDNVVGGQLLRSGCRHRLVECCEVGIVRYNHNVFLSESTHSRVVLLYLLNLLYINDVVFIVWMYI